MVEKTFSNITKKRKAAAIVLPVYKEELNQFEVISLKRCREILSDYTRILAAPIDLNIEAYLKIDKDLQCIRFDQNFFKGYAGYNSLMLSKNFYEQFSDYTYILIHQLDVFIFRDELMDWCEKDYDYIGAPWYKDTIKIFLNVAKKNSLIRALKLISTKKLQYRSGNGGLSLRKVQSCIECLDLEKKLAENFGINEDYFWSFFSRTRKGEFKIPDFSEAVQFAIEKEPRRAYKLNNFQLPFGVHAWERWDPTFWKPFIEQHGYQVISV